MSAPLDFLKLFAGKLREAGIQSILTSGMACVHYNLQQTTKDSDWIVGRGLLSGLELGMPPWRVCYRSIFGAPLETGYMAHGWTSHISIWDRADSPEHRVDLFSKPPRVTVLETDPIDPMYASRHVVAQMKRTDRERDWPMVDSLGLQLESRSPELALLHIQKPEKLMAVWRRVPLSVRKSAIIRRPLLELLNEVTDPDKLDAWLRLERLIWQTVNQERYGHYARAWRDFFRRWRREEHFAWPTSEPFHLQHQRVCRAAAQHDLPHDPLGAIGRSILYERALQRVRDRADVPLEKITKVQPPLEEILP